MGGRGRGTAAAGGGHGDAVPRGRARGEHLLLLPKRWRQHGDGGNGGRRWRRRCVRSKARAELFDYQLRLHGSFVHDVAFSIVTSLSPAARRAHEQELLRYYLCELRAQLRARGRVAVAVDDQAPAFENRRCATVKRQTATWWSAG